MSNLLNDLKQIEGILKDTINILERLREERDLWCTTVDDSENLLINGPSFLVNIVKDFEDALGVPRSKVKWDGDDGVEERYPEELGF